MVLSLHFHLFIYFFAELGNKLHTGISFEGFSLVWCLFSILLFLIYCLKKIIFVCKMKLWECFLESIVKENMHAHDCIGVSSSTATCSLLGYFDQKYKHWWRKQLWPPEVCCRTLTPVSEGRGWMVWYNPLFGLLMNLYSTSHCQWIPRFTEESQLSWALDLIGTFWWLFSAASN